MRWLMWVRKSLAGGQLLNQCQRLLQIQMRMVLAMVQRTQHQRIELVQFSELLSGNGTDIGDVSEVAYPEAQHRHMAMHQFNRCDKQAFYFKGARLGNSAKLYLWCTGIAVLSFKNIGKALPEVFFNRSSTKDGHIHFVPEIERAHVIQPNDVVVVLMGDQNGVQPVDPCP